MDNQKTYIVLPQFHAGMLSPEDLEEIARISKTYNIPQVKITGAQRVAFLGAPPEVMDQMRKDLNLPDSPPHKRNRLHYIQACPGSTWCKYGVGNSLAMAKKLEQMELEAPLPSKVKVAISGCRMCCCESWMRDVGLAAEKKGWRFTFGGNAAGNPRIGDVVADQLNDEEAFALIQKTLHFFINNTTYKSRSARFVERIGIDAIRKAVV